MPNKRTISDHDKRAAKRLKLLWNENKDRLNLTQERASTRFDAWSQSAIGQYLNGIIALNATACLRFAMLLECSPKDIYPELFKGIDFNRFSTRALHESGYDEMFNLDADRAELFSSIVKLSDNSVARLANIALMIIDAETEGAESRFTMPKE